MSFLSETDQNWVNDLYQKIIKKESVVIRRSGNKIPYTTENGVFGDMFATQHTWWTNGFWEGILWLMAAETDDVYYKELANRLEDRMDEALYGLEGLDHDVGFMWLLSSVANYRLTGNKKSKVRGLIAANYLASRFNPDAGFIGAWNMKEKEGWSIIDTMMNLPLLYWASEETDYARFAQIAKLHADKSLQNAIRPDGSVAHIIDYDLNNGSVVQTFGGQGYEVGSSWTRGQGWALYGFVLSYIHTKEQKYLDVSKRIAHYFLAAVADHDYIPPIDFRSPGDPQYVDTTAGAIAAAGLIEIAKNVDELEQKMYINSAVKILRAISDRYADWSEDCDAILHCGSEAYRHGIHMDIVYGDYFFIEAIFKLHGMKQLLW